MAKEAAASEARQRILDVADHLFFTDGIRVTGVDSLVARSGVAKTTLYRHFASKDDLVVAYLEDRDRRFWQYLKPVLEDATLSATGRLYATMEKLEELINHPETHGCPFLLAAGEFPDLQHPAHQVAVQHKERMRSKLEELARAADVRQARALASGLAMLIDGAFSGRRLLGAGGPPITLLEPAKQLSFAYGLVV